MWNGNLYLKSSFKIKWYMSNKSRFLRKDSLSEECFVKVVEHVVQTLIIIFHSDFTSFENKLKIMTFYFRSNLCQSIFSFIQFIQPGKKWVNDKSGCLNVYYMFDQLSRLTFQWNTWRGNKEKEFTISAGGHSGAWISSWERRSWTLVKRLVEQCVSIQSAQTIRY